MWVILQPILGLVTVFKALGGFWRIVRNAGKLLKFGREVQAVVENYMKDPLSLPSRGDADRLLTAVIELIDSGVIDIPGVDEKDLSEGLKELKVSMLQANDVGIGNLRAWGHVKGRPVIDQHRKEESKEGDSNE